MRQETARVIMDEQRLAEEIRLLEEEADKQRRVSRAFQLVTQLGAHLVAYLRPHIFRQCRVHVLRSVKKVYFGMETNVFPGTKQKPTKV